MDGCIVVGTDGSDTAGEAVKVAIELARLFVKPLHVVSAYRPDPLPVGDVPAERVESLQPQFRVESMLADVEARCRRAGIEATPHAIVGDAAEAILDTAEKLEAGLIVVGNRGIGSKTRFLLGNVPSKVVHHSPCSVYVVHTT